MQHLHDRETGVEPDEVRKLERPHRVVRAEPHGGVDRFDVAHPFIERVDRLVDHRQQNSVDDERGEILRHGDGLAELCHVLLGRVERRVIGGDAADELDQLHERHRIHEMDADEALRPVGRGGEPRDRDRRRIAADDGVGLEQRADAGEDRALDLFLLGRCLNDEIAIAQGFERLRRRDAFERGLPLFLCDALAAHLPRHVAVDGRNPGLDPVGGKVVELDVESGERADMGDAVTHLSRPDHADLANMKRHVAGTGFRPLFDLDHVLSPFLRRSWPWLHGRAGHHGQRPSLPSSAANSGSAW